MNGTTNDGDQRRTWQTNPDEPSFVLEAVMTGEGIILDAYAYGELQGTTAMTAGEWFDSLLPQCVHCRHGLLDTGTLLVDTTGGDVCAAHGTNHMHCKEYDPYDPDGTCNGCRLDAESHGIDPQPTST